MYKQTGTCLQLLSESEEIRNQIRGFSLSLSETTVQELLIEEILNILHEEIPADTQLTLILYRRFQHLITVFHFPGNPVDLFHSAGSENMEASIRSHMLINYSQHIDFRNRNGINTITIRVIRNSAEEASEKILAYYSSHKENPPSAVEQFRWGFHLFPREFLLSAVIKIFRSLPVAVLPVITANVIDIISQNRNIEALWINLIAALLLLLSNIYFSYLIAAVFEKTCRKMEEAYRIAIIQKLQILSISFHNELQNGVIISKVIRDAEYLTSGYLWLFNQGINILVYAAAAIIMTLINCPWMSLFFLFCIPAALFLSSLFQNSVSALNYNYRTQMEQGTSSVDEMLQMIPVTRAHGLQNSENRRLSKYINQIQKTGIKLDIANETMSSISWFILQFFQLLCLGVSAFLAGKGMISLGMIALFQSYFSAIVIRASNMMNEYPQFAQGMESFNSIAELLCTDLAEHTGNRKLSAAIQGHIQLENISFRFRSGADVIHRISLDIPAKSTIAFIGPSGCGKTTLINIIIGFYTPDEGKVFIDGYNLFDLDLIHYRNSIAVVPQHSILFHDTLYNNLTYGLLYVSESDIKKVLSQVGMEDYINSLPDGLETIIDENGGVLSGGQLQRIAVARALLRKPRILIMDEPTSALDSDSEEKIIRLIDDLHGICTIILIAHRLNTVHNADQIFILENGTIKAQGQYDDIKDEL